MQGLSIVGGGTGMQADYTILAASADNLAYVFKWKRMRGAAMEIRDRTEFLQRLARAKMSIGFHKGIRIGKKISWRTHN